MSSDRILIDTEKMDDIGRQLSQLSIALNDYSSTAARIVSMARSVVPEQPGIIRNIETLRLRVSAAGNYSRKVSGAVLNASRLWQEAERKVAGSTLDPGNDPMNTGESGGSSPGWVSLKDIFGPLRDLIGGYVPDKGINVLWSPFGKGQSDWKSLLEAVGYAAVEGSIFNVLKPFIWSPSEQSRLREVLKEGIFQGCWNAIAYDKGTAEPGFWKNSEYRVDGWSKSAEWDFLGMHNKGDLSLLGTEYKNDGANRRITSWIGRAHSSQESDLFPGLYSREQNVYIGRRYGKTDLDFSLFKYKDKTEQKADGSFEPNSGFQVISAAIGAETGVSAFFVDDKIKIGNDMLGLTTYEEVSVLDARAGAEMKFNISDEGVNAYVGGEAMVAAARGKGKATFSILGLDIDIGVSGYAGAAGVEGKAGIVNGKLDFKADAALGLGAGFDVSIGLNDAGWDYVMQGIRQKTEMAGQFVEDAGQFVQNTGKVIEQAGKGLQDLGETFSNLWS